MTSETTLNRVDIFKIILAIMTFGIGWFAENQATVISFSAVIIVWFISLLMKRYKLTPTKASLTVIVFAVAIILSLLFHPVIFPLLPSWDGDASVFAPLLVAYGIEILKIVSGVVAYAMSVYNILLAQVLEKVTNGAKSAVSFLLG